MQKIRFHLHKACIKEYMNQNLYVIIQKLTKMNKKCLELSSLSRFAASTYQPISLFKLF